MTFIGNYADCAKSFASKSIARHHLVPAGLLLLAIALSLAFILLEWTSIRRFGTHDYRLFRSLPAMAGILILTVLFVHHSPSAIFVYARN